MPPAVATAALQFGLPAAATLGGAVIGSRGNNRAIAAQERARQEALTYERERETNARHREDQMRGQYRQDYAEWLERNFGVRRPIGGSPTAPTGPTAAPAASGVTGVAPGALGMPPAAPGAPGLTNGLPAQPQGQTLADLGGWENWRRYGVGG